MTKKRIIIRESSKGREIIDADKIMENWTPKEKEEYEKMRKEVEDSMGKMAKVPIRSVSKPLSLENILKENTDLKWQIEQYKKFQDSLPFVKGQEHERERIFEKIQKMKRNHLEKEWDSDRKSLPIGSRIFHTEDGCYVCKTYNFVLEELKKKPNEDIAEERKRIWNHFALLTLDLNINNKEFDDRMNRGIFQKR